MTQRKKDASGKKTVYPHVVMHTAARCALEVAEGTDDGSYYQSLLCSISLAFCLEAYFNFLGEKLIPAWKSDHEKCPAKDKLKSLARASGYKLDATSKEYDSFIRVFALRNALAHGKVESVSGTWNVALKGQSSLLGLETAWEKLATPKAARAMYEQCSRLVTALHRAANQRGGPFDIAGHGIGRVHLR